MHYLIDGHNLIGKMPDISLAEADDEVQLVLRLKGWVAGSKQRQATVIFDGGLAGGVAHRLSSRRITVVFAPPGQTADLLLIQRLRRLKNPREYTLVSSDQEIINVAQSLRIRCLRSEEFIERMGLAAVPPTPEETKETKVAPPDEADDVHLTEAEIAAWLELFGPTPESPPRPRARPNPRLPRKRPFPKRPFRPRRAPRKSSWLTPNLMIQSWTKRKSPPGCACLAARKSKQAA